MFQRQICRIYMYFSAFLIFLYEYDLNVHCLSSSIPAFWLSCKIIMMYNHVNLL